jgi:uncharacterized protein (DUF362 family)
LPAKFLVDTIISQVLESLALAIRRIEMESQKRFKRPMGRREILRWMAMAGVGLALDACAIKAEVEQPAQPARETASAPPSQLLVKTAAGTGSQPAADTPVAQGEITSGQKITQPSAGQAYLAVAHGQDPASITEAAIRALGGMEHFVKEGFDVILKPNICTDYYSYEYAATTNPVVVATMVKLALGAGAKRVRVMDFPFGGTAERAYATSGIAEAVKAAGGEMELMNPNKFKKTKIPQGISIKEWEIYQDALSCDLLVDIPIAKHHNLARLTLGGKNLLGVIQSRSSIHADFGQRIADLASIIRPGLTVIDAVRVLMDHGPTGGSLDDVKLANTVVASHDIVAADSYATGFFNLTGKDIAYIGRAAEMGLGVMDLHTINIEEITV